jgi:WD40 repeat protein
VTNGALLDYSFDLTTGLSTLVESLNDTRTSSMAPRADSVAWSADSKWLAVGNQGDADGAVSIYTYDLTSGRATLNIRLNDATLSVPSVAWSQSGLRLVTGSADRKARVYDIQNNPSHVALVATLNHDSQVLSVSLRGDGSYLAAAAGSKVQVYSVDLNGPHQLVNRRPRHGGIR